MIRFWRKWYTGSCRPTSLYIKGGTGLRLTTVTEGSNASARTACRRLARRRTDLSGRTQAVIDQLRARQVLPYDAAGVNLQPAGGRVRRQAPVSVASVVHLWYTKSGARFAGKLGCTVADQLVDLNDDVLVADAVRRLVERFAPLRIILFGSRARGTAERDSDIDLLVVLPELHDKYMATVEMLRELRGLGIPVDVVPTDPEEVKRRGHVVGSVLREAIRHGKVVYERAGG